MNNLVTLVLILHNRHRNIDRLLKFYETVNFQIIIADSSRKPYRTPILKSNVRHLYTPSLSFTEKLEKVLFEIDTKYVVLCADDDFIIPQSIIECIEFLEYNSDFAAAQGKCISYRLDHRFPDYIDYRLMYPDTNYDILDDDPLSRLKTFFSKYRSLLYAVHRTDILKICFEGAGSKIRNLYLNEYLTACIPVALGKVRELNFLFQVREFSETSDDKVTDNLDRILSRTEYSAEASNFIEHAATRIAEHTGLSIDVSRKGVREALEIYINSSIITYEVKPSVKKRLGIYLSKISSSVAEKILTKRILDHRVQLSHYLSDLEMEKLSRVSEIIKSNL